MFRFQSGFLGAWTLLAAAAIAGGQEARPAAMTADERAVRASAESFARAYNAGDARALAAQFAPEAVVVEADGSRYRGREAIESEFAESFRTEPGVKIALSIDSIRFPSPDVALEEGRSTLTAASGGAPLYRRYSVVHVKQDGKWLLDSVREEDEPMVRPHDRLKVLEWMLGEWTDEGSEGLGRTVVAWSKDGNYLLRTLTVHVRGEGVATISQRIGWDPLTKQIKSWEFGSDGGHGEGLWTRDGARWIIKHTGVTPDGRTGSATHVLALEKPNRVRWTSIDRIVGGAAVPDEPPFTMVRTPPAPADANRPANSNPSTPAGDTR
jgi:uncharacterized protein (TIGR02246 family)